MTPRVPHPVLAPGRYTVLAIIERVLAVIIEEPRRLYMRNWLSWLDGIRSEEEVRFPREDALPACGTVACVSGWIGLLTGVEHDSAATLSFLFGHQEDRKEKVATAAANLSSIFWRMNATHAEVVDALRAYITKHRDTLAALTVEVGK